MKKVKKIPNCCSYNSPGFTYSQPFQTDAQMVLDLKLSYEHPPNRRAFIRLNQRIYSGIAISEKHVLNTTEVVLIGGLFRMICLVSDNFCMTLLYDVFLQKKSCRTAVTDEVYLATEV